jgi:hypothetical protein
MAFVSNPLDSETLGKNKLMYAPLANSAVVVGFNIEKNFKSTSPLYSQNGTLVTDLKLNARIIAKLLTQSYRSDVPGGNIQDHVANNPRSLVSDPEFLALNPDFADFQRGVEPGGLMVALGSSDAATVIWHWLQNDTKAAAFLRGEPDEWGMVLNKYYTALSLATDDAIESYPKADLSTYRPNSLTPEPGFSTLDMRPYATDMLDAALAARRGDPRSKTIWDVNKIPPSFTSGGAQPTGQRFMIAITDLPAALRYGLGVASLVNSFGDAVAPNDASIAAGLSSMKVDPLSGISFNDGKSLSRIAYPWTMMTYAVVNPCTQDSKALGDYSDFLKYAAGPGQISGEAQGELPRGFLKLPDTLVAKTNKVANDLLASNVKTGCPTDDSGVTPTPRPTPTPTETSTPVDPPVEPEVVSTPVISDSFKTWAESPAAGRNFVLGSLFFALPVLLTGRALIWFSNSKRNRKDGGTAVN